ncbi:MAG: protein kinase [Acidobacteriia bacterium]|nr:protein kinase [Terriglobia bacterium]
MMQDWTTYRGQSVDGVFPLGECLSSTRSSAVFGTSQGPNDSPPAVIKLIRAEGIDQNRQLSIWEGVSRLTHPNLMRLLRYGHCQFDGEPMLYLLIERADEVLGDVLAERPLSAEEARQMLAPVVDVLAYLHGKGYVHGRVKPGNLFAVDERLKISCESVMPVEAADSTGREPAVYDAPELASGLWSTAADAWSLGWTLVESLTQQRTGRGSVTATLPAPFEEIVRGCLDPDPERRWSMARISSCLRGEQAGTASTSSPWRRYAVAGAVVAAILIAMWASPKFRDGPADSAEKRTAIEPVASPGPNQPSPMPVSKAAPQPKAAPKIRVPPPARAKRATTLPQPRAPLAAAGQAEPTATGVSQEVVAFAEPHVQDKARRTITGTFRVSVRVDLDGGGNVTQAALESPGPSPFFAKLALEAARKSKFSAGENGRRRLVEIEFSRKGSRIVAVR